MTELAFQYHALDTSGAIKHGTSHGATQADVYRQLASMGLTPVKIKPAKVAKRSGRGRRVKLNDLAQFTQQFGVLISSGIPVSRGLRGLAEQEPNPAWSTVIDHVASRIEAGSKIAKAMAEHPKYFDDLYVATIHAAEESGTLSKVLDYMSEMLERDAEMRSSVRSAMMYPVIVVCVLGLASTFLVGFIVPKFAKMFHERGVELPIVTRIVMGLGDSVQSFWYLYLVGIVAGFFTLRAAWSSPTWRQRLDGWLHRIPYVKRMLIGLAMSRFTRVLGLCLHSRLSLIDAFHLAGRASGRPLLIHDAQLMADQIRRGATMPAVLGASTYMPAFARRLLLSGAETGELVKMCGVVAKQHERETQSLVKNLTTVIEPVLIVVIAAVVLVVALAIFLPMWNMVKVIS